MPKKKQHTFVTEDPMGKGFWTDAFDSGGGGGGDDDAAKHQADEDMHGSPDKAEDRDDEPPEIDRPTPTDDDTTVDWSDGPGNPLGNGDLAGGDVPPEQPEQPRPHGPAG